MGPSADISHAAILFGQCPSQTELIGGIKEIPESLPLIIESFSPEVSDEKLGPYGRWFKCVLTVDLKLIYRSDGTMELYALPNEDATIDDEDLIEELYQQIITTLGLEFTHFSEQAPEEANPDVRSNPEELGTYYYDDHKVNIEAYYRPGLIMFPAPSLGNARCRRFNSSATAGNCISYF